ncbi:MAG TPA: hypothetical protein VMV04_22635 [Thermodesulfobacteriota bacterium]|nr:hypothetical protein [Thermodesulfobacteriota bacterium]
MLNEVCHAADILWVELLNNDGDNRYVAFKPSCRLEEQYPSRKKVAKSQLHFAGLLNLDGVFSFSPAKHEINLRLEVRFTEGKLLLLQ